MPQNSVVRTALISKEKMYVICGSGFLELKEVQLEGKKRMCIGDFLRGNRIENGIVLGEVIKLCLEDMDIILIQHIF